jgi:hypothetical protein
VAGDERHGLAPHAAADQRLVRFGEAGRRRTAAVGQEPGAIPAERVARQDFGVDRGGIGSQPRAGQRLARRGDPLVDGQWDGSDW